MLLNFCKSAGKGSQQPTSRFVLITLLVVGYARESQVELAQPAVAVTCSLAAAHLQIPGWPATTANHMLKTDLRLTMKQMVLQQPGNVTEAVWEDPSTGVEKDYTLPMPEIKLGVLIN